MIVIEMNPRVSRSSALASKATGFPIAKVAARLAVGYTLDEIENDITGGATPASFEPTIDYVVTKIPRFAFEKFPGAEPTLTTAMKSVGESMAIGRTFQESLQKALRSLETGLDGLDEIEVDGLGKGDDKNAIKAALGDADARPHPPGRAGDALRLHRRADPRELQDRPLVPRADARHRRHRGEGPPVRPAADPGRLPAGQGDGLLRQAPRRRRRQDRGRGAGAPAFARRAPGLQAHRHLRRRVRLAHRLHVLDLCHAPSPARPADEAKPTDRKKVVILGGGPNRIGQGIEFDYCCCHACYALKDAGYETIMVNCNPETVSTDYDTSDRLYFEPLTAEDVLEILETEKQNGTLHGVIVQFGGQTPLKLAERARRGRRPILGTSPDAIDLAEDRDRFKRLLDKLGSSSPRTASPTPSSRPA
jgi:carbamoyl-phosphate synthase large subunit